LFSPKTAQIFSSHLRKELSSYSKIYHHKQLVSECKTGKGDWGHLKTGLSLMEYVSQDNDVIFESADLIEMMDRKLTFDVIVFFI